MVSGSLKLGAPGVAIDVALGGASRLSAGTAGPSDPGVGEGSAGPGTRTPAVDSARGGSYSPHGSVSGPFGPAEHDFQAGS